MLGVMPFVIVAALDATVAVVDRVVLITDKFADSAIFDVHIHGTKCMAKSAHAFSNFCAQLDLRGGIGIMPLVDFMYAS